jgi:large subunit ribosomal protein L17
MRKQRKLGRRSDQRKAMLRGLVTALFEHGRIKTTLQRADEVQSIVEKIIGTAVKEVDNFTSKEITKNKAVKDSSGQKMTVSKTSKHGSKYEVVERENVEEMVTIDAPSRLKARRQIISVLYEIKDEKGEKVKLVNKIFDEIAPKYKERNGGYTRIYKLGPRRGDAAEEAILELVE